ncbi:hypothetical protein ACJJTC_001534 [Scirpophaga incertulas]
MSATYTLTNLAACPWQGEAVISSLLLDVKSTECLDSRYPAADYVVVVYIEGAPLAVANKHGRLTRFLRVLVSDFAPNLDVAPRSSVSLYLDFHADGCLRLQRGSNWTMGARNISCPQIIGQTLLTRGDIRIKLYYTGENLFEDLLSPCRPFSAVTDSVAIIVAFHLTLCSDASEEAQEIDWSTRLSTSVTLEGPEGQGLIERRVLTGEKPDIANKVTGYILALHIMSS